MVKAFEKVVGYAEIKTEMERICDRLRNPQKYEKLGVSFPGGLLLHGNPGVGKSLLASCFIEACGMKTFICRKNKPDGDFVNEIKQLFEKAHEEAPSIIYLDDMDKFANEDEYHTNAEEFITIQSCIDEVKGSNVFVLATANDLRNLPSSLLRVGRFDKTITVPNPSRNDAALIVKHYLNQKKYVADINADEIADLLNGSTCAQLETVINEAGIYAGFNGKQQIEMEDIVKAFMSVIHGISSSFEGRLNNKISQIAYHEAGHAVISEILHPGSVKFVCVGKGNGTRGLTSYDRDDNNRLVFHTFETSIMCSLGGKAAIEVKYGTPDIGCNEDMHKAFDKVATLVDNICAYGFDAFVRHDSGNVISDKKDYLISQQMERYYQMTRRILMENSNFLDKMAEALMEKKILLKTDIDAIREIC